RDDERLGSRELAEVGRDVRWIREAAVDAAEPTGPHEANADRPADRKRSAYGRRADSFLHHAGGEVARAGLARTRVEPCELCLREADSDLAVEHADRRRHRAGRANAAFGLEPDRNALARRETVGDQRRLERDDRVG